jgi:hypothetical protein
MEGTMTLLENSIHIDASPEAVWRVLATLDILQQYDPGVTKSALLPGPREGIGAARRCDLAPGGWFEERVTAWTPHAAIGFELFACTLPVKGLKHRYTLTPTDGGTLVTQRMLYTLKFGPLGWAMDALMVRRKWNEGIRGFFTGLKTLVETPSIKRRDVGHAASVSP